MFVGFCNYSVIISSKEIIEMYLVNSCIIIDYGDDKIKLEYDNEKIARDNWQGFFKALKSGEYEYYFD